MRLRPRNGKPRTAVEWVSQHLWRWRLELIVFYIAAWTTAAVMVQIGWV